MKGNELSMVDSFSAVKMLISFILVLGLIFLFAYLYRKLSGIRNPGLRNAQVPMAVVGNLPMGDRRFLAVVEVQGEYYFIGITPQNINLISKLDLELPEKSTRQVAQPLDAVMKKARDFFGRVHK